MRHDNREIHNYGSLWAASWFNAWKKSHNALDASCTSWQKQATTHYTHYTHPSNHHAYYAHRHNLIELMRSKAKHRWSAEFGSGQGKWPFGALEQAHSIPARPCLDAAYVKAFTWAMIWTSRPCTQIADSSVAVACHLVPDFQLARLERVLGWGISCTDGADVCGEVGHLQQKHCHCHLLLPQLVPWQAADGLWDCTPECRLVHLLEQVLECCPRNVHSYKTYQLKHAKAS